MKKIIIAENIMRDIGRHSTIFGRCNITTYTARTSEEIVNIHGVRKADLIVADSELPLMGGAKLCAEIRTNPDLKNVSIIMACNHIDHLPSRCLKAGANAVIMKPVDPVRLFSKISELLVIPRRKDLKVLLRVSALNENVDSYFLGLTHNISISGLLMETERELKQGDRLTCAIPIGRRNVVAESAVMRVNRVAPGRFRYGVKFMNLEPNSFIVLEQFIKSRIGQ